MPALRTCPRGSAARRGHAVSAREVEWPRRCENVAIVFAVHYEEEFETICKRGLDASPTKELLIEESLMRPQKMGKTTLQKLGSS